MSVPSLTTVSCCQEGFLGFYNPLWWLGNHHAPSFTFIMGIKGKLVFEDSFRFLISPNYFLYGKPSLSFIKITAIKIRLPISVA